MSSQSSALGPLSAAAADFERELARYEKISNELGRTTVHSQKTLSRTQKLLGESAECEDALGQRLRALLEAMNGARDTQQTCMEKTLAAAKNLQNRASEFTALLERVSALGARARDTSEPAIAALTESAKGEQNSGLLGSLEDLGDQMLSIVKEAELIAKDAEHGDWPDISRDVQSLRQQVIAAHGKIVQATTTVGTRLLS
jgi:chromosome segregation ATPase